MKFQQLDWKCPECGSVNCDQVDLDNEQLITECLCCGAELIVQYKWITYEVDKENE